MNKKYTIALLFILFTLPSWAQQQRSLAEEDFYELRTIPIPEDVKLEVGGITVLPDGRWLCARAEAKYG